MTSEDLKLFKETRTSYLYYYKDYLVKAYKDIEQYSEKHLSDLLLKRFITNENDLPVGPYYDENGKFIGVIIKYYKDALTLCDIKIVPYSSVVEKFLMTINDKIKVLTDNNVYPLDFDDENALIDKDYNVRLIDLDDIDVVVTQKPNKKYLRSTYVLFQNLLLSTLFEECDEEFGKIDDPIILMEKYNISEDYVNTLLKIQNVPNFEIDYHLFYKEFIKHVSMQNLGKQKVKC